MLVRPLVLAAFAALALTAATAAQAFTFEDKGAAKSDDSSMFLNDHKSDPMTSGLNNSGHKTIYKEGNTTVYFSGPRQTFEQRNNPNSYFTPDYLMGK